MDFVKVLNDNRQETLYYYQNNWKIHRERAVKKGYIHSFRLLESTDGDEPDFDFILITTYQSQEQYDKREDNFGELIESHGDLRLLNDKEPGQFRKIVFSRNVTDVK